MKNVTFFIPAANRERKQILVAFYMINTNKNTNNNKVGV